MNKRPILYSFLRCPYAIRARMACQRAKTEVDIREVNLKDKPDELLQASPKGTVPVFIHGDGRIIDESADIVKDQLMSIGVSCDDPLDKAIIEALHVQFIPALLHYKYSDRYPHIDQHHTLSIINDYLHQLDQYLVERSPVEDWEYLDIMLLPLIRQCYIVNMQAFNAWGHGAVERWLQNILTSDHFKAIMQKHNE
tara:strand:- start:3577 stop:4164 length:588 start_codon:yes stop_codon:yes gene_type:complete